MLDRENFAASFAVKLSDLLWDRREFRGHNVGGMGQNMHAICKVKIANLVDDVKKVFPVATNVPGKPKHRWIPRFLSRALNRHFRTVRSNDKQG